MSDEKRPSEGMYLKTLDASSAWDTLESAKALQALLVADPLDTNAGSFRLLDNSRFSSLLLAFIVC